MDQRKTQTKKSLSITLLPTLLNHVRGDNCVRLPSAIRCRILLKINGYEDIRMMHLVDLGTLYRTFLVTDRVWDEQVPIHTSPTQELQRIYVKVDEEAEKNDKLNDLAREAFKALE